MRVLNAEQTGNSIPAEFKLYQNFPNPFNPATEIKFGLPKESSVKLIIYDLLGREVARLVDEKLNSENIRLYGMLQIVPADLFYQLQTENFRETRKLVLMK
jgi:hypothetical protein